ncbi:MAG: antibiotic biosynthesis monooxygenase [Pseudomonadota bacterium]
MRYVTMNRFSVKPDETGAFEALWLGRETFLHEVPGFVEFQLLRGPKKEDHVLYASHTVWESEAAFLAWTRSDAFRKAHAGAGEAKPIYNGAPVLETFEVLQTV